ncbi:MAG: hypothetical protein DRP08_01960 [Candidatus Aenigmatarchaeota archaeon]|nr:MAG: hypothetical protein DRP08_01960 [Candidatus Aenigmarchaeota archaeon]
MKGKKFQKVLILILISCLILFSYNYSWANYSQKHEEFIGAVSSFSDSQEIHRLMYEIPEYEAENNSSSIYISPADEEVLYDLAQVPLSVAPLHSVIRDYAKCHLPNQYKNYHTFLNTFPFLLLRNAIRRFRKSIDGDFGESGGRQPYYCGTVELSLDEIYQRLDEAGYKFSSKAAYEDVGEITDAKKYYRSMPFVPPFLYLFSDRQKHIRIFPTEKEGVYEIRAHDEPSTYNFAAHLHWFPSKVSDTYDEVKEMFPEIKGEPKLGTCQDEGKIKKWLRKTLAKILR